MVNIKRVIAPFSLLWPTGLDAASKFRGAVGYVVDMDAPLEAVWCAGQEHKLEDAPPDAVADEVHNRVALTAQAREVERMKQAALTVEIAAKVAESDPAAAPKTPEDIERAARRRARTQRPIVVAPERGAQSEE